MKELGTTKLKKKNEGRGPSLKGNAQGGGQWMDVEDEEIGEDKEEKWQFSSFTTRKNLGSSLNTQLPGSYSPKF